MYQRSCHHSGPLFRSLSLTHPFIALSTCSFSFSSPFFSSYAIDDDDNLLLAVTRDNGFQFGLVKATSSTE
ncbi:hypothetical protein VNO78_16066 [Psophocarpus tetragonolobus]|uniref:Uncharacterized protein n=1 Tax=Psophocarpus tetragonolobus TaxID=3891 RepID=A0AAN9SLL9_PSOTE